MKWQNDYYFAFFSCSMCSCKEEGKPRLPLAFDTLHHTVECILHVFLVRYEEKIWINCRLLNSTSCFIATGCLGDRNPWLQPDDLAARRGTHSYSSASEAFLPQLRIPASPATFVSVASPSTSSYHAILHFGPRRTPCLLQHPYDAAEWTGGRKYNATNSMCCFCGGFMHPVYCMHIVFLFIFVHVLKIVEHVKNKTPLFSPGVQSSSLGNKRSVWIKDNVQIKFFFYPTLNMSTSLGNSSIVVQYALVYLKHGSLPACNGSV